MDPREEEIEEALVLDTNIILASILKRGSYTRQVIVYLTDILGIKAFTPEKTMQEIREHLGELALKKKKPVDELLVAIRILLLNVEIVSRNIYEGYLRKAGECVRDPGDIDFAALALSLTEKYDEVFLLTWNISDYRGDCLEKYNVGVFTPSNLKVL